jgi:hypothetical protein
MLDDLVQTTDPRRSRETITFRQPAGQSCVRSGGWACGRRAAVENVRNDGDLALDGQRGMRVGLQALGERVTPKLDGLDLPDEVRQKIYYGNALRVPPGAATDRLVIAAYFTDAADHHLVLWTVRQASRRRPSAAVMAGRAVLNRGWR